MCVCVSPLLCATLCDMCATLAYDGIDTSVAVTDDARDGHRYRYEYKYTFRYKYKYIFR